MKFTEKSLQNIADLARLDLSKEELVLYGEQLSSITTYIEKLQTAQPSGKQVLSNLNNVWREDKVESWNLDESEDALLQANREAGLVRVKRVL